MVENVWSDVDHYLQDELIPKEMRLDDVVRASTNAGLPQIQVSATQGAFLEVIVRAVVASRVLEIGTLGGFSAIHLARGVAEGGTVLTLEKDPGHAKVARSNIQAHGLDGVVTVIEGDAIASLDSLISDRVDPFDLIFIDADKPGYPAYLERSIELSRNGTLILADNVVRDGNIVRMNSSDVNVQGVRSFLRQLGHDDRLRASAIQTVGSKGYDGLAVAVVTGLNS